MKELFVGRTEIIRNFLWIGPRQYAVNISNTINTGYFYSLKLMILGLKSVTGYYL